VKSLLSVDHRGRPGAIARRLTASASAAASPVARRRSPCPSPSRLGLEARGLSISAFGRARRSGGTSFIMTSYAKHCNLHVMPAMSTGMVWYARYGMVPLLPPVSVFCH
jgi:hypothetical protein